MQLSDLSLRLHALSVLRGVLRLPLVNAYAETLSAFDRSAADFADRYGALCAARFACGDISRSFLNAVHFDVNTLTDTIDAPADALLAAATHDIDHFVFGHMHFPRDYREGRLHVVNLGCWEKNPACAVLDAAGEMTLES